MKLGFVSAIFPDLPLDEVLASRHGRHFRHNEQSLRVIEVLEKDGHGLNLTAADYVFLLDPWWNPAVEAQAIDRAHRVGQTRTVFAYRLKISKRA